MSRMFSSIKVSGFTPLFLATGLATGLAFGATAIAADKPPRDPVAKMAEHLNLNESQKSNVAGIFERHRPAKEALRDRGRAHHDALDTLDPKSRDYSVRAQALADQAGTLARDRVLQRTQMQAELAAVLTPEQMSQMREQRERRHQRGGRGKHGPERGEG